jgi:hypothetical protein
MQVSSGETHRHARVPACGSHVFPGGHGPPHVGACPQVAGTVVEVEVAGVVVVLVVVVGATSVLLVVVAHSFPHASQQLVAALTFPPRSAHRCGFRMTWQAPP